MPSFSMTARGDMRSLGYLVAFILGMVAAVAIQGRAQTWLIGSGLAIHLDGKRHCNSITEGGGLEHDDYAVGFYRNSNCRWSLYAGRSWMPLYLQSAGLRLGAIAGVVTGYNSAVLPVAALAASVGTERYKLNIIYVPPAFGSGNVIWLQSGLRW
ncbi:MAG TPA: hypothetical protein VFA81_06575 [Burkholderiales bacterium]|nr:hypothetical protein [Burkholderiales bacterium]